MKTFQTITFILCIFLLGACQKPAPIPETKPEPVVVEQNSRSHDEWITLHNQHFANQGEACDTNFPEGLQEADKIHTYEVGEDQTVYEILCSVHAYQNNYVFYLVPAGSDPTNVEFEYWVEGEKTKAQKLITPSFDPETKTLVSLAKGRGLGDCGNESTYEWKDDHFELTQVREKTECDGERDPWPVIF